jgi:large subunit ribosomal protein L9
VEQVGLRGDVVNVARGFMRNYLEPRGLAERATPAKVAELAKRDTLRARHEAATADQAQEVAAALATTVLRFERNAGTRGRLFGSVTSTDIADELWRTKKIRVDRRKIELDGTIKRLGTHVVPISIFEDVRAEVQTQVVPEGGELPSEDEIAAWEAEERAEAAEAAGEDEEHDEAEAQIAAAIAEEEAAEAAKAAEAEEEPAEPESSAEEQLESQTDRAWDQHETPAEAPPAEPTAPAEETPAEPVEPAEETPAEPMEPAEETPAELEPESGAREEPEG